MELCKRQKRAHILQLMLLNKQLQKTTKLKQKLKKVKQELKHYKEIYLKSKSNDFWYYFNKLYYPQDVQNSCTKFTPGDFGDLLSLLQPLIEKQNLYSNIMTKQSTEPIALTLRYLTTGADLESIANLFNTNKDEIIGIISTVCDVIWDVLEEEQFQPTKQNWLRVSEHFEEKCHFPNCIGVLKSKLIKIESLDTLSSIEHLIITCLMSADLKILITDIGVTNELDDDEIFENTNLGQMLLDNELSIPEKRFMSDVAFKTLPYVIVGDQSYDLEKFLMCPLKTTKDLTTEEQLFNIRLEEVNRISDNVFGVLASKWGVYTNTSNLNFDILEKVIKATIVLHNWFMDRPKYCDKVYTDYINETGEVMKGSWRAAINLDTIFLNPRRNVRKIPSKNAVETRELFIDYFKNENIILEL